MKLLSYFLAVTFIFYFFSSCKKEHTNKAPIANAGNSIVVTLPDDSVKLIGSGTDADGQVVAYLWSEVSGPNTPTIANSGASSTSVTGLIAGTYIFQLMVTDNQGATGADTTSVLVNPAIIDTLILQPANNPNEITLLNYNGTDGSSPTIEWPVEAWTNGGLPFTIREIFKFDLSSIPSSATITSADLQLYSDTIPINGDLVDANYGATNALLLKEVTQDWDPSTITWFNQPSTSLNNIDTIPATTSSFLNLSVDMTKLIADVIKNNSNYGFLLEMQNEVTYNSRIFCSSLYSDSTRHPKLIIYYSK